MIKCTVTSPLRTFSVEGLEGIFLKTVSGERGILRRHVSLVAQLKPASEVRLKKPEGEVRLRVGRRSFFRFKNDEGILLTEDFRLKGEEP